MSLELLDNLLKFATPHRLSREKMEEAVRLAEEIRLRESQNQIDKYYPTAENRRQYPVHMDFFAKGRQYRERLFMAANRVGKTEGAILYETVLHATGLYPDWWPGRRFDHPVECWVGGDTGTSVRDILQAKLLGKTLNELGTGLIRASSIIGSPTAKRGIADAVETIAVRHAPSGGISTIQLKTYEQGRIAWQGTSKHVIALDEEVPEDIAGEAVMRTMDCDGIVLYGYTPLNGMTEVTQKFLDEEDRDIRCYVNATWDDVPHLSQKAKDEMIRLTPPHLRDARSKGVPTQGVGSIYPIQIESLLCEPFALPKHFAKGYALDVGWNRTAALWAAMDREADTMYIYDEHYEGQQSPVIHASAIKRRGRMLGQIDPAARGRSQKDGETLLQTYRDEGLMLALANNAVEAGILAVWTRAIEGRLKIFRGKCPNLEKEWRLYHRDKNGQVVKKNDHLLDDLRYLCNGHATISYTMDAAEGHYAYTAGGVRYLTSLPSKTYRHGR